MLAKSLAKKGMPPSVFAPVSRPALSSRKLFTHEQAVVEPVFQRRKEDFVQFDVFWEPLARRTGDVRERGEGWDWRLLTLRSSSTSRKITRK